MQMHSMQNVLAVACFSKDHSTVPYIVKNPEAQTAVVTLQVFSTAQNNSQVHHNTLVAAHFWRLCVPTGVFSAWLCRWMLLCPPTYFVKWTITFWLSSLIPRDHAPIVYFILLLWVLCISEIAKIVDPGLWNSTSFIWAVAWITSSSSAENMLRAPGIKGQGSGECCL